jgi:tRNA(adenine34) deaminase
MQKDRTHQYWMLEAIKEAEKAYKEGEVPVGAVIVSQNRMIGRGHNRIEALQDATAHAEIIAITAASNTLSSWRLTDAFLYVTLEPCIMCCGAIMNARLSCVIFGASDPKAGACGSIYNLLSDIKSPCHVDVVPGILEERCRLLLRSFFQLKRK